MDPVVRVGLVLFVALMIGVIVLYHRSLDRRERREAQAPAPGASLEAPRPVATAAATNGSAAGAHPRAPGKLEVPGG